jgi:hypothetical protein
MTITLAGLVAHMSARDAIMKRLDEIARYCHAQRKIVWENSITPVSRWKEPEPGVADDFEIYDGSIWVSYWWSTYDGREELTVKFPADYLDRHDSIWQAIETSAAAEAVSRKTQHVETLAQHAAEQRRRAFEQRQEQVRQRMIETVPGFGQMTELTQQSIIATALGART